MPSHLLLRTPCCDRAVTKARAMQYATEVVERTCPSCRALYVVVVRPLAIKGAGIACAHEATWEAKGTHPPKRP